MGVGPMSPDGHVATGINVWMLLSTVCCVCACISTFFYLRVRDKYLQRQNDEYAQKLREQDASCSRPAAKKKRADLEKMLREMQREVAHLCAVSLAYLYVVESFDLRV